MERFKKSEFMRRHASGRVQFCQELAQVLSERLAGESEFHQRVLQIVHELRSLGHDLWSYDESDESEVWGPNYQAPSGPGIVVTFSPQAVNVEWSDQ